MAGANLGGGKAKRDPECDKRELARLVAGLGYPEMAMVVACGTEAAMETLGPECRQLVSASDLVQELRRENELLRDQLETQRIDCNEAKNRIFTTCQKAK